MFHRAISGSNVYFVRSGSSWVLIDTSWPKRGPLIKQSAERLFGVGTRPAAILLTHAHPDHAGSALELTRSWDLPVYVHPHELPLAAGKYLPEYGDPIGRWLIEPLMRLTPRRRGRMEAKASITEAAHAFNPEAGVPGLPDWECIPTPGHTPGHVAFFRPSDRVLITGDAVLTLNFNSLWDLLRIKQRVSGPPWISTWSWPTARESVAALVVGYGIRVTAGTAPRPTSPDGKRIERAVTLATIIQLAASFAVPFVAIAAGHSDWVLPSIAITIGPLLLWLDHRVQIPRYRPVGWALIVGPVLLVATMSGSSLAATTGIAAGVLLVVTAAAGFHDLAGLRTLGSSRRVGLSRLAGSIVKTRPALFLGDRARRRSHPAWMHDWVST